jgi:hypothetical protein
MLEVFNRGSNSIALWFNKETLILISYETPVAFTIGTGRNRRGFISSSDKATSQTSQKHISKFFRDVGMANYKKEATVLAEKTFTEEMSDAIGYAVKSDRDWRSRYY